MRTTTPTRPKADAGMTVRRMSLAAYDTAVHAARTAHAPDEAVAGGAWAELEQSGIAKGGRLLAEWARALGAAPTAPVQVRVTAHQGPVTFTTDVTLLPGLGLASTQRSFRDEKGEGGFEPVVELVAFPPEQVWPAIRRALPPHDALRADPAPTSSARRQTVPADGGHSSRDEFVAGADASVELVVAAHTPDGVTRPVGAHQWLLTEGQLSALGPDGERTTLDPGA
ncbi:hypothetical protein, partial [Janibacter anophelis]|uniref:hypothetical protein n=1 Tax=Janibacter anophelis TaxID=319054 RepID=UPI0039EEF527